MSTIENRSRIARTRAKRLGLTMHQHGELIDLCDATGTRVHTGYLAATEAYLETLATPRRHGPDQLEIPPAWRHSIDLFIAEERAAQHSPGTIRLRVKRLASYARSHPNSDPLTVTRDDLVDYISTGGWAPRGATSVRSTFRIFFRLLVTLDLRPDDPAAKLPAVKIPRSLPRPIPDSAVREALSTITDERALLAIRIATETGCRCAELTRIKPSDVRGAPGGYALHVVGKAGHQRRIPLADDLADELRGKTTAYVLPSATGGMIAPLRLSKIISAALPAHWTAHTLRHRFATAAYRHSHDLRAVQELMGHASPVTTAIYTEVSDDAMRTAAAAARLI